MVPSMYAWACMMFLTETFLSDTTMPQVMNLREPSTSSKSVFWFEKNQPGLSYFTADPSTRERW